MGFHESAIYPINLSYGSTFGPGFNAAIIEGQSGRSQRIPRLEQPLYGGDLATGIRGLDEFLTLRTFYIARQGAAYGFRFTDPLDNTSAADGVSASSDTDQNLGEGDGSNTLFQLRKQYTDSLITRNRAIEKPVAGTVTVSIDDSGTGAFSVNTATGVVTMNTAPLAGEVIKAGFDFHVPVRFTKDVDDGMRVNMADFDAGTLPPIGVIEDRNGDVFEDEFFYGGSVTYAPALNEAVSLSIASGRVVNINTTATGSKLYLPNGLGLPGGGPYFFIRNSGTVATSIVDYLGTTLLTLAAGVTVTVLLKEDPSTPVWWFF